jgi:lysozyme
MSHDLVALDASHWNPSANPPDWQKAIDAEVVGIFLKCTEGDGYVDPTFRVRYDSALEAGLAVSSYHFCRPGDLVGQMEFYLSVLQPRQGERVVIDWEDAAVGLEDIHDAVDWLTETRPDLQITIYGSSSFLKERVPADDRLGLLTSLWVASYTKNPQPTHWGPAWETYSLWQFSDKATVAGYGPVDGNRFNGSSEACRRWMGPVTEEPPPPALPTLTVTVEADEPVNLNIVTGKNIVTLIV